MYCRQNSGGSVLIVGLWMLFFLGALAVAVGVAAGGRVELARRLDLRLGGFYAAKAGVARAIVVLAADTNEWDGLGERWANGPADFSNAVNAGYSCLLTAVRQTSAGVCATNLGLSDEMARVDINRARVELLAGLLETAGGIGSDRAAVLAGRIDRIRSGTERRRLPVGAERGGSETRGAFKSVHELLFVEGFDHGLFDRIREFVTVCGGSRVNVNTAGPEVLTGVARAADLGGGRAAPAAQSLVRKVLKFRESGGIFTSIIGPRLAGAMGETGQLSGEEGQLLFRMSPYLTVSSDCFRGRSSGMRKGVTLPSRTIEFVWDRRREEMTYWHEY